MILVPLTRALFDPVSFVRQSVLTLHHGRPRRVINGLLCLQWRSAGLGLYGLDGLISSWACPGHTSSLPLLPPLSAMAMGAAASRPHTRRIFPPEPNTILAAKSLIQ